MATPDPNDDIRRKAQETASIVEDALRSIASQVGDIFEQALSGADTVIQSTAKDLQSRFNKMAKITDDIASNITQLQSGTLKTDAIQNQINKRKAQEVGLGIQLTTLLKQQNVAVSNIDELVKGYLDKTLKLDDAQKELVKEYLKAKSINDDYIGQLEEQNLLVEEQKKKLGATGGILKGLTKIPVLGNLINAEKGLAAAQEEAAKSTSTKFSVLTKGIKGIGPSLSSALGPLALITAAVKAIQFFIGAMFEADKQVTNIAKSFNISKEAARGVREEAFNIKENIKDYVTLQEGSIILQKELVDTQLKFNSVLGMSVNLISGFGKEGQNVLAQLANMVSYLQLSDEELKGITNLYVETGKEVEDIKFQILGTVKQQKLLTGLQFDERKVLKDVLTVSNATRLSIKGGTDALIKSVIESQKLGKNLNELDKIGESLLNFEQSIAAELEAEILLGRDLNLEKARSAYFTGDTKTFQEEINRLVKESGPDFKNNVIAQQSLAAALGLSREELADMVTEQEKFEKFQSNMIKLSEKELEIIEENLKAYGIKGKLSEATISQLKAGTITGSAFEQALKQIGVEGENLTDVLGKLSSHSLESSDAQEKFNKSLDSAKEVFTRFVDGGSLDKLANFITKFVSSVGIKGLFSTIFSGFATDEEIAKEMAKSDRKQLEEEIAKGDKADKGLVAQLEEKTKKSDQTASREEYKAGLTMETGGLFGIDQNLVEYIKEIKDVRGYEADVAKAEKLLAEKMAEYDKNLQPGIGAGAEFANGGIVTSPITNATVGEAGPEAIIPLRSPMGKKILNVDQNNTSQDNSQVIAAINKLTEAIISNSSKEVTLAMDGQTVGKVLTPLMTPMTVREINNTSVAT